MATREAPGWFRQELLRRFGAGHDAEWDGILQRWVIVSPSVAGLPTRQPVVWYRDPHTGQPAKRDESGLMPMKELTTDTCWEIIRNMERSALTNRHDGAQTWGAKSVQVQAHNEGLQAAAAKAAADVWADAIADVDLRRPWVKHYSRNPNERRVAWGR